MYLCDSNQRLMESGVHGISLETVAYIRDAGFPNIISNEQPVRTYPGSIMRRHQSRKYLLREAASYLGLVSLIWGRGYISLSSKDHVLGACKTNKLIGSGRLSCHLVP